MWESACMTDRQRDGDRVKDLLASGVPPKGLEARALTFGGTEGSMLVRRGWFDAVSKGMVQCQIEGNGLMLGQRGWFDAWFNYGSKVQIVQCLVEGYDLLLSQKVWFEAG